jgi:hypothetical protein
MEERRRSPRRRLQKTLTVINMENGETLGEIFDISPEGLSIKSKVKIRDNNQMELRLLLPVNIFGKNMLDVEARCVWTRSESDGVGYYCGFEFIEVSPADVGIIIGLIMDFGFNDE